MAVREAARGAARLVVRTPGRAYLAGMTAYDAPRPAARMMRTFAQARGLVLAVRDDMLAVYWHTRDTCELASELLAVRLAASGYRLAVVCGQYDAGEGGQEHCWVTADGLILDSTCDQYGADPGRAPDRSRYRPAVTRPAPDLDRAARLLHSFAAGGSDGLMRASGRLAAAYGLAWPHRSSV